MKRIIKTLLMVSMGLMSLSSVQASLAEQMRREAQKELEAGRGEELETAYDVKERRYTGKGFVPAYRKRRTRRAKRGTVPGTGVAGGTLAAGLGGGKTGAPAVSTTSISIDWNTFGSTRLANSKLELKEESKRARKKAKERGLESRRVRENKRITTVMQDYIAGMNDIKSASTISDLQTMHAAAMVNDVHDLIVEKIKTFLGGLDEKKLKYIYTKNLKLIVQFLSKFDGEGSVGKAVWEALHNSNKNNAKTFAKNVYEIIDEREKDILKRFKDEYKNKVNEMFTRIKAQWDQLKR